MIYKKPNMRSRISIMANVLFLMASTIVLAQGSIESRLNLPRTKLHCDPFIPAASVRLDKNGEAKRDKYGNVIFDPPSAEEIKRQRRECTSQVLHGKMFNSRKNREEEMAPSDPDPDPMPPPDPTIPVLVGPPDDTAYHDPTHDMWFGMIWNPVPDADVHILCISSGDGSMCPSNPGLAMNSQPTGVFSDVIQTPSGRTTSVYEMPEFCYPMGRCLWSVAACFQTVGRLQDCKYAEPLFRVRVTD